MTSSGAKLAALLLAVAVPGVQRVESIADAHLVLGEDPAGARHEVAIAPELLEEGGQVGEDEVTQARCSSPGGEGGLGDYTPRADWSSLTVTDRSVKIEATFVSRREVERELAAIRRARRGGGRRTPSE